MKQAPGFQNVAVQVKPDTEDVHTQVSLAAIDDTCTNRTQHVDVGTQMSFRELDDSIIIGECANLLDVLLTRRGIPPAKRRGCETFIRNTVDAVVNSYQANVYNLVFGIAKAISRNTISNDKQVLPFNRLPYQILEYQIKFANGGCQSFVSTFMFGNLNHPILFFKDFKKLQFYFQLILSTILHFFPPLPQHYCSFCSNTKFGIVL